MILLYPWNQQKIVFEKQPALVRSGLFFHLLSIDNSPKRYLSSRPYGHRDSLVKQLSMLLNLNNPLTYRNVGIICWAIGKDLAKITWFGLRMSILIAKKAIRNTVVNDVIIKNIGTRFAVDVRDRLSHSF